MTSHSNICFRVCDKQFGKYPVKFLGDALSTFELNAKGAAITKQRQDLSAGM